MSTSRPIEAISATSVGTPAACASSQVPREAVRPEARLERVGRRQQQRVRAVPWRSGTITAKRSAVRGLPSSVSSSSGSISGQSPATHSTRRRPARARRRRRADRRILAALRRVVERTDAVALGDPLRALVAGDDEDLVDRVDAPQRGQHVGEHRLGERAPRAARERALEAPLRAREALDRQDCDGLHRRRTVSAQRWTGSRSVPVSRRAPSRTRASRARGAGARRRRSSAGRSPAAAAALLRQPLVGDEPVEQVAVDGRDARGGAPAGRPTPWTRRSGP